MPDITTIAAALASFNALKNIAQTMIGLHDAKALQAKIIEFNGALIDAQTKIFSVNEERTALIERVSNLEKEVANLKAWETTKQRCELKKFGAGVAMFLKPEAQGTEPSHPICANCYEEQKKRFLYETQLYGTSAPPKWRCPNCSTRI